MTGNIGIMTGGNDQPSKGYWETAVQAEVIAIDPEPGFIWVRFHGRDVLILLKDSAVRDCWIEVFGKEYQTAPRWEGYKINAFMVGLTGQLHYHYADPQTREDGTQYYRAAWFQAEMDEILRLTGGEYRGEAMLMNRAANGNQVGTWKANVLMTRDGLADPALQAERDAAWAVWQGLWDTVAVPEEETPENTAAAWAEAFAAAQTALPEENPYGSEEFRILDLSVVETSEAGDRLVLDFSLAAKNREGTPRLWICGGGSLGKDEWDGWVLNRRWVNLSRGEDGLWRASAQSPQRLSLS